jgi:GT2 family glycosyltransferase
VRVVTQPNSGGAGGFFTGIKLAAEEGFDWIWVMDDDTIPSSDALLHLVQAAPFSDPRTGYLCSLVLWKDDSVHEMNVPALPGTSQWIGQLRDDPMLPVISCSFVSALISRRAVLDVGLPLREFFIWFDDVEYTARISRRWQARLVPQSVVTHLTGTNAPPPPFGTAISKESWNKYFHGVRNYLYILRTAPGDRPFMRLNRLWWFVRVHIKAVLLRRQPPRVLVWVIRGFGFSPKLERVREVPVKSLV